jgi:hypothetical protein
LCEAAASLLLRSKRWSALKAWGMRIAKRASIQHDVRHHRGRAQTRRDPASLVDRWLRVPEDRRRQGDREGQIEAGNGMIGFVIGAI